MLIDVAGTKQPQIGLINSASYSISELVVANPGQDKHPCARIMSGEAKKPRY